MRVYRTIEIPSNGSGGSDDLLQLLDPFEGDCPSAIDFCDDVFDLLVGEDDSEAPVLDLEGDVPFDCTFERSSSCGIGTNRNKEDNLVSLTSQNSAEDDCIAGALSIRLSSRA